jgi:DNA-directed RNA polymerase beta' subunit
MLHWLNGPKRKLNNSVENTDSTAESIHPKKKQILDLAIQNGLSASVINTLKSNIEDSYFTENFSVENTIKLLITITQPLGNRLDYDSPEELFFNKIAAICHIPADKIKIIFATLIKGFKTKISEQEIILQIEEILSSK